MYQGSYQKATVAELIDEDLYEEAERGRGLHVSKTSYKKPIAFGVISLICAGAAMLALVTTKSESGPSGLADKADSPIFC